MFADDTVDYLTISSDCHQFQKDLDELVKYVKLWKIKFYYDICSGVRIVTQTKNPIKSDYKAIIFQEHKT